MPAGGKSRPPEAARIAVAKRLEAARSGPKRRKRERTVGAGTPAPSSPGARSVKAFGQCSCR
ncbi:hypothetical protein AQ611_07050 [Burkholderia singularis]|nr:hypothetical protein AQ611_07050 [Burkholderia sp. Bp7605]